MMADSGAAASSGESAAGPSPNQCALVLSRSDAERLFARIKADKSHFDCKFEGLRTDRNRAYAEFTPPGAPSERLVIAPAQCLAGRLRGPELTLDYSDSFAARCPKTLLRLESVIKTSRGSLSQGDPTNAPTGSGWLLTATQLLFVAALVVGGWWLVRLARRWRETRGWLLCAFLGFVLALGVRLAQAPSLANWYTEVLGSVGLGRFGPGAHAAQLLLSRVASGDRALFVTTSVIGALMVPLSVALARERRMTLAGGAALALFTSFSPLMVRVAVSGSEHAISATLVLASYLSFARFGRDGDRLAFASGLIAMLAASLTRADAWLGLAGVLPWIYWRDAVELELVVERRTRARRAAAFALSWGLWGVPLYLLVVLPSQHPLPEASGVRQAAVELLSQYFRVAFIEATHWVTPLSVVLATLGLAWLGLRRRWALLTGVLFSLACMFIPLGRNLVHDELLGGRYFVASLPLLGLFCAAGVEAVLALAAPRWRRLQQRVEKRAGRQLPAASAGLAALLLSALGLLWWHGARDAYAARFTFQDEYDFLRRSLAQLPAGCRVYSLPIRQSTFKRDLDCCLDAARSPLLLAYPELRFRSLDERGQRPQHSSCDVYFESAACSIQDTEEVARLHPRSYAALTRQCTSVRQKPLEQLSESEVSGHAIGDLFGGRAPVVRLFRYR